MRRTRRDVTYLSFGYHGDRSPGVIPEPQRNELISVGTRILTAWYATSVLADAEVDLPKGIAAHDAIAEALRSGLAEPGQHQDAGIAGMALMLHAPSGWECGLIGSPLALRPAIVAAVPPHARLMLDPTGEVWAEWGDLSIETNWQHWKSELGRDALREWRTERKRA